MMIAVYFTERKIKIAHLCWEKQVSLIGRAAGAYSYRYASKGVSEFCFFDRACNEANLMHY
jgi:hypothetical protein